MADCMFGRIAMPLTNRHYITRSGEAMEEKLFGLTIEKNYFEVIKRDDRYYVHYDAGSYQPIWREDEISEEQALKLASNNAGEYQLLLALQRRLGAASQISNWAPNHQKSRTE